MRGRLARISPASERAATFASGLGRRFSLRDLAAMPWLAIPQFYRRNVTLKNIVTGEVAEVAFQPRFSSDSLHALGKTLAWGMTDQPSKGGRPD